MEISVKKKRNYNLIIGLLLLAFPCSGHGRADLDALFHDRNGRFKREYGAVPFPSPWNR